MARLYGKEGELFQEAFIYYSLLCLHFCPLRTTVNQLCHTLVTKTGSGADSQFLSCSILRAGIFQLFVAERLPLLLPLFVNKWLTPSLQQRLPWLIKQGCSCWHRCQCHTNLPGSVRSRLAAWLHLPFARIKLALPSSLWLFLLFQNMCDFCILMSCFDSSFCSQIRKAVLRNATCCWLVCFVFPVMIACFLWNLSPDLRPQV